MSDMDSSFYCGQFQYVAFDHDIPEDDFSRFVVTFIDNVWKVFKLEDSIFPISNRGRNGYSMKKMSRLVYYSFSRGFTKASVIADMAKNHTYFKYVANGITPDEDTINNFINQYGSFFEYLVKYTVSLAFVAKLTGFKNVDVDGTFAKSANNKFNVIHKDDTRLLIRYYSGLEVDDDELDELRFPAKKFKNRSDMTDENKLKHLKRILKRFDETDANTIPINDIESIHMVNKSGNTDVGYNIQTAVDNESKMFIATLVTQKATDHNLFPVIITKAIENMGQRPGVSCADAAYNTERTLQFINEMGLNSLIDNKRDAKLRNGHGSQDKFHKDNMGYDFDGDYFICYNNEKLHYQRMKSRWDDKKADYFTERIYFNKEACSNCEFKNECCKKAKYRTVKISGGELTLEMMAKFQNKENILEYIKRFSTVEAPNGTMRNFFHINEILAPGLIKTQNRLNICAGSYNLIRIYHELIERLDLSKDLIIEIIENLCSKNNIIMRFLKDEVFPFVEKKLLLPYRCESCIDDTKYEKELPPGQLRLI